MSKKGRSSKSKKSTTRREGAPPSSRGESRAKAASVPPTAAAASGDSGEATPSSDPARSLPPVLTVPPGAAAPVLKVSTPMKVLTPIEFTRDVDPSGAPPVAEHEHEHGFFADDARPALSRHDHTDDEIEEPRSSKMTPAARARRELFTKYVKGTVALLTALCIVALLRAATDHGHRDDTPVAHAQTTIVAANVQAAPAPTQLDLARVPAPLSAAAAADKIAADEEKVAKATADSGTKAEEAKVEDAPKPADAPKVEEAKIDPPKSDKTAGQEKAAARQALESGRAGVAIEAGERSVALDPTDGEAWLLLGAAYQEKGKTGDARRCFNSCLKQGKKGPIGECRQMLQ